MGISYLSKSIINSFPRIEKRINKIIGFIPKINHLICHFTIHRKLSLMRYDAYFFQHGLEPVLIQKILIGLNF